MPVGCDASIRGREGAVNIGCVGTLGSGARSLSEYPWVYGAELDFWRLRHLKIKSRNRFCFGMCEDDPLLTRMEDLSGDELMELLDE